MKDMTSVHVLVVDDDESFAYMLADAIVEKGHQVDLAFGGEEGLNKFFKRSYDLVITDLVMPRLDGFRTARLIKFYKPLKKIPIIFLTARDAAEEIAMAQQTKAEVYITKPFDVRQVLKIVNNIMASSPNA